MGRKFKKERRSPEKVMEKGPEEQQARFQFRVYIRNRREELQWNQDDLAREVESSSAYIALIEAGKRVPDLKMVPSLADALRLDKADTMKKALEAFYPEVYQALFGKERAPELSSLPTSELVSLPIPLADVDFCERYPKLSTDMKTALHAIVDRLYKCQLIENRQTTQPLLF